MRDGVKKETEPSSDISRPRPTLLVYCPECDSPMLRRRNSETGEEFLGCSRYPECRGTRQLDAYFWNISEGSPRLPGF